MGDYILIVVPALIVVGLMSLVAVRPIRRASVGGLAIWIAGGLAVIIGIALLVVAALEPLVENTILECEKTGFYDCADERLLYTFPIMSGGLAAILWPLELAVLWLIGRHTRRNS